MIEGYVKLRFFENQFMFAPALDLSMLVRKKKRMGDIRGSALLSAEKLLISTVIMYEPSRYVRVAPSQQPRRDVGVQYSEGGHGYQCGI